MATCTHRQWGEPDGLPCTREAHDDRGHVYASTAASHLGEGPNHLEPMGDQQ